ncbi:outer membrane lipoprotein-sorting protein [bacterium]|nr:outer membrane lipoprotein-sorting protein [bacterium]
MKHKKVIAGILLITLIPLLSAENTLSARQIVEQAYEVIKLSGIEAVSEMTIIDKKGNKRVREVAQVSKLCDGGNTEKRLIRFLSPADVKGTSLLTFDYEDKPDDIWLFMPALRKTRRIVSSEKSKRFMGSEFSYADMSPPPLDDFKFILLGEENVGEIPCWKIEIVPVTEDIEYENGFSKKISYFGKEDLVIRKSLYYDTDEELEKTLIVKKIQEVDTVNHKYRPVHMVMENIQNGRSSILMIKQIKFNPEVKDEYFSIEYLER